MGYIKHEAVIVTTWNKSRELDYFLETVPEPYDQLFVKLNGVINDYDTYFMAPDGSKEGWEPSTDADKIRADFLKVAQTIPYVNIVYVGYGGDHGSEVGTTIEFTTDKVYENEE